MIRFTVISKAIWDSGIGVFVNFIIHELEFLSRKENMRDRGKIRNTYSEPGGRKEIQS